MPTTLGQLALFLVGIAVGAVIASLLMASAIRCDCQSTPTMRLQSQPRVSVTPRPPTSGIPPRICSNPTDHRELLPCDGRLADALNGRELLALATRVASKTDKFSPHHTYVRESLVCNSICGILNILCVTEYSLADTRPCIVHDCGLFASSSFSFSKLVSGVMSCTERVIPSSCGLPCYLWQHFTLSKKMADAPASFNPLSRTPLAFAIAWLATKPIHIFCRTQSARWARLMLLSMTAAIICSSNGSR